MNKIRNKAQPQYNIQFLKNVVPTRLTESRCLKIKAQSWGLLSEYYLESVKINNTKGNISSTATLRLRDIEGEVTCIVKGPKIGFLFGMTPEEWGEVESMSTDGVQLFYRYFKNGLSNRFSYEQKLFYNFCLCNQKAEVLVVVFKRCVNLRNVNSHDALIEVLDIRKCNDVILDLYINFLRQMKINCS